jgi:hypothetical protein
MLKRRIIDGSEPTTADGLTTDRLILYFLTESVWPSNAVPSQRTADGWTTDRLILYFLTESVWPSSAVPSQRTEDGCTTDRLILYFLTESVWPSIAVPSQRTADGCTTDRRILFFLLFYYLSNLSISISDGRPWTMDADRRSRRAYPPLGGAAPDIN